MISSSTDAIGVIFSSSYDSFVPGLCTDRSIASLPFGSRYRMIDFTLSGMVTAGIDNISILVDKNYHSLMDHVGNGREWDLSRKSGGLNIVPPSLFKTVKEYNGRVEALLNVLTFIKSTKEKYIVISDAHIVSNLDFKDLVDHHASTGADITIAYADRVLNKETRERDLFDREHYYTLSLTRGRVKKIEISPSEDKKYHLSMNVYVINKDLLISELEDAYREGYTYFERDILVPGTSRLKIMGYKFEGYMSLVSSIRSYFNENMKLLERDNYLQLFKNNPVYTKIRDDTPTKYSDTCDVSNTMVADGCIIEGTVENSILFRGVTVEKGAVIRNSIVMQGTKVCSGSTLDYVIADKDVTITPNQSLTGTSSFLVYIKKGRTV